jgi:hypothetical protein
MSTCPGPSLAKKVSALMMDRGDSSSKRGNKWPCSMLMKHNRHESMPEAQQTVCQVAVLVQLLVECYVGHARWLQQCMHMRQVSKGPHCCCCCGACCLLPVGLLTPPSHLVLLHQPCLVWCAGCCCCQALQCCCCGCCCDGC